MTPAPVKPVVVTNAENKISVPPPSSSAAVVVPQPVEAPAASIVEKTQTLTNEKLKVVFTNLGGTIKEIIIKEYAETLPVTNLVNIAGAEQVEFKVERITAEQIVYSALVRGNVVTKTYTLLPAEYVVDVKVAMSRQDKIEMFTLDISRLDKNKFDQRDESLFEYSLNYENKIERKSGAFKFSTKEAKVIQSNIHWLGFRDRYFCLLIKPRFNTASTEIIVNNEKSIGFNVVPRETSITYPTVLQATVYFGPQTREILAKYKDDFEKLVIYSNWGIIDACAKAIYALMIFIHKIIPSWGTTIIILGIVIYLLTYPLTLAGMSSMRKMQSLQPQMTKLREQYKSNPQKLNQEMMELYKKHKVNPFGGCLPMLIQMPVFIALYQILWRAVVLKGHGFLWIKDLSYPDRLFVMKSSLPIIGNEINVLPVLMTAVMFVQQKLTAKTMVITDETQAMQQKMMLWFLPGMMFVIFYKAASGLTLYFTILYIMTALTQLKMNKAYQG